MCNYWTISSTDTELYKETMLNKKLWWTSALSSLTNMSYVQFRMSETVAKVEHNGGKVFVSNEASTFLIRTFPRRLGIQQSNGSLISNERKLGKDYSVVRTYLWSMTSPAVSAFFITPCSTWWFDIQVWQNFRFPGIVLYLNEFSSHVQLFSICALNVKK